jgi:FkbM family methyltransferase
MKSTSYQNLLGWQRSALDLTFVKSFPEPHRNRLLNLIELSHGQLRQDLFVLTQLKFKREGFFVEFGATDGISLSNSYLLEKEFSWNGILAEPAKLWHKKLFENREASISTKCVWSKSGESVVFKETSIPELSRIEKFGVEDDLKHLRKKGFVYLVETISLEDLLVQHNAPLFIDYLSIDTEGSELEILEAFNFKKYRFGVITCEHNYSENQQKIRDLLESHGYRLVYQELSEFDGWYISDEKNLN